MEWMTRDDWAARDRAVRAVMDQLRPIVHPDELDALAEGIVDAIAMETA